MNSSNLIDNFFKKLEGSTSLIESSVIVIDREGKILKESLENKPYNHGLLTNYFAMKLECEYLEDSDPFLSGINLSNQGYVVLQIDADNFSINGLCLCFFPDFISHFQISSIKKVVKKYRDVCYQYFGNLEDEYLSYQEIILYLDSLKKEDNSKVKCRTKIKD